MSPGRRRALNIAFFAAIVVVAAVLYPQLWSRRPPSAPPAPPVAPADEPPAPPPRLAPPAAVPDAAPAGAADGRVPDEHAALLRIRALVKSDPVRAEALVRESRRRSPEGPFADERDALLVDSLINQQRIGAARDETYYYLDHHPQGRFAEHLFTMTGVHPAPRRNPR